MSLVNRVGVLGMGRFGSALARGLAELNITVHTKTRHDGHRLAAWAAPCQALCLAVRDDQIRETVSELSCLDLHEKIVLIHSGAKPLTELAPLSAAGSVIGKFHPLQSFSQAAHGGIPRGTPFAIEGDIEALVRPWVAGWSGTLHKLKADQWPAYHLAAVLAANFLPLCIRSGAQVLRPLAEDDGDALDWLAPLIRTSVTAALDAANSQPYSGPAVREDHETLLTHEAFLQDHYPDLLPLYREASALITASVSKTSKPGEKKQN